MAVTRALPPHLIPMLHHITPQQPSPALACVCVANVLKTNTHAQSQNAKRKRRNPVCQGEKKAPCIVLPTPGNDLPLDRANACSVVGGEGGGNQNKGLLRSAALRDASAPGSFQSCGLANHGVAKARCWRLEKFGCCLLLFQNAELM